jgi:hypothetical protein
VTSSPPRRTRIRALAALPLALALATSACGAGFSPGTGQVQRDTNGSAGVTGNIAVRNLILLQDEDANPVTTSLVAGLANNSNVTDELTGVQVADADAVALGNPIPIPGRGLVTPGVGDGPSIEVANAKFRPGGYTTVTLTFKNSGQITLDVLVMPPNGPSNGA